MNKNHFDKNLLIKASALNIDSQEYDKVVEVIVNETIDAIKTHKPINTKLLFYSKIIHCDEFMQLIKDNNRRAPNLEIYRKLKNPEIVAKTNRKLTYRELIFFFKLLRVTDRI